MTGPAPAFGPHETESLVVTRFGGPEVFALRRQPVRAPGPGELTIRVRFAGLNFADIFAREGLYGPGPKAPFSPGFEVAGEVEAVGPDVRFAVGERVIGVTRFGGYTRRVTVSQQRAFSLPDGWSLEEGAAFPGVAITAWHGLANVARCRPGERVLVHSAAGGVGIAAGQIGRALGLEMLGTVGSPAKVEVARAHGYSLVVDYSSRDFEAAVREHTKGEGVDVVLDAIGGSFFEKGYRLLRDNGRLLCFGLAGMTPRGKRPSYARLALEWLRLPRWNPIGLIDDNKSVAGFQVLRLWEHQEILDEAMQKLLALAREGKVRPVVAETFPLERGAEAQARLHSGRTTGKIVLAC